MKASPCRILIGPLYHARLLGDYAHDPQIYAFFIESQDWRDSPPAYDIVVSTSDFAPERRLIYNYQNCTIAALLAQFPASEQPELLIWWGLYGPIPVDIAECPIPTLLVVSDWHENLTSVLGYVEAFDFVVADQGLCDLLLKRGQQACAYWPSYALYPERSFLIDPPLERVWDIAYIGSLNFTLHPERERYLQRLLKLADRYKILIDTHLYGAEYNDRLNQSKLVFNYSIRGEMNLRAFEAAASGAVVLIEEGNLEIERYLPAGLGHIRYNSENFESQIAYYLTHESERQALADYALAAVQAQTATHQFERLLALIPAVFRAANKPLSRPFQTRTRSRQALTRIRHLYHLPLTQAPEWAVREAVQLFQNREQEGLSQVEKWECGHFLAACLTDYEFNPVSQMGYRPPQSAETVFAVLLQAASPHPLVCANAAWYCFLRGDFLRALPYSEKTLQLLNHPDFQADSLLHFVDCLLPFGHNYFYLHWQRLFAKIVQGREPVKALLQLLCWNMYILQAQILASSQQASTLEQAEILYQKALMLFPEFGTVGFDLACLQVARGHLEQAVLTYADFLERHSFHLQAHQAFLELLIATNKWQTAQLWLEKIELLANTIPHFQSKGLQRLAMLIPYLETET
jgi:hypothetical protein